MTSNVGAAAVRSLKSGPVKPLIERWRLFKRARPEKYGGSYAKNMLAEAPHLYLCMFYAGMGLSLSYYKWFNDREWGEEKPYKDFFHIMRPDDPRIKFIRKEFYGRVEDIDDINVFKRRGT